HDLRRTPSRRRHGAAPPRRGGDDRRGVGHRLPRAARRQHHGDDEAHGGHRGTVAAWCAVALGIEPSRAIDDSMAGMTDDDLTTTKRLQETAARLRTLGRLNRLVSSSLAYEEVLGAIARAAADIMATPSVSFWVV